MGGVYVGANGCAIGGDLLGISGPQKTDDRKIDIRVPPKARASALHETRKNQFFHRRLFFLSAMVV
jgi:hypothetical protein